MNTFLTILIVLLAIGALVSLVRGVIAFLQSSREDLLGEHDGKGASEMQLKQNRMMKNRVIFQALAIVAVLLLLMASR